MINDPEKEKDYEDIIGNNILNKSIIEKEKESEIPIFSSIMQNSESSILPPPRTAEEELLEQKRINIRDKIIKKYEIKKKELQNRVEKNRRREKLAKITRKINRKKK
jgi:hypothetical protein